MSRAPMSMQTLSNEWVLSLDGLLDPKTRTEYLRVFETEITPRWPSVLDVTTSSVRAYISESLGKVLPSTIRKRLSPLRGLMAWLVETEKLPDAPLIPGVPKRAVGTKAGHTRAASFEVSKTEVLAIIRRLPVFSKRIGPVRPRFEIQYEHGLRSETMDKLELGKHYRRGGTVLNLEPGDVKDRQADEITLSKKARKAFEQACKGLVSGPIFGSHDYREHVSKAVQEALAAGELRKEAAEKFAPTHLRSAAITHFLDRGASLSAAQKFARHKLATTTDKYVKPSRKALEAEMRRQGRI